MRKASLSRMPMTIAWALSHSFLRRWERALRCLSADRRSKSRGESRSSSQRLAVAENLDPIPEFMAQRAEQAGFRVPYARRFAAAQRAESERDLACFFVDLRPSSRLGAIQRVGDDPENLRGAQLRVPGGHAIVEADDVPAGGEEKADDGDKSGVRNHEPPRLFSFRTTSFSPDQMSSTAQTLMSTRPIGNATSLIVSSVMSVGTLDDFFGQDTQIDPSCLSLLRVSRSAAVRCALSVEKM